MLKRVRIPFAALLALLVSRFAFALDLRQRIEFHIPAQALSAALIEFSHETRIQVIVSDDITGQMTGGITGSHAIREALRELLAHSGLAYRVVSNTSIVIGRFKPQHGIIEAPIGHSDPAAAGTPAGGAPQGSAPSTGTPPGGSQYAAAGMLEEIVVTAQKYRQRAFDVPISMTVLGGTVLRRLGITDLEDLQFQVPGMFVQNQGYSMQITIRGISDVFGQGALVGTYLDEADVTSEDSFGLDLDTYDLARIEVLKGPQGTLYGEGSLGGTVRYITNKPALREFQMGADVTALFDQYGAPEDRVYMVVNSPVVAGVFGLRIAAELDQGGGWVDQPAANRKNINGKNLADARIEGRWQPRSDLTIDATEVIHRETSGPYVGENPPGTYIQAFNLTTTPQLTDDYNISNVALDWSSDRLSIVNSSTYFRHYNNQANTGTSFQFTPPPSPRIENYYEWSPVIDESFSDELRFTDGGTGPWRWVLGGLYKGIHNEIPPALYYYGVPGPPGSPLPPPYSAFYDVNSNTKSVFGDTNYRLLGRLVLGAGVRYFGDDENALIVGDTQRERAAFTSVDPRFYARYGVSEQMNLYASAAKGFRSGGFNGLGLPPYQPERVWTYELGTKMRLLGARILLNLDVFYSNYAGYLVVGIPPQGVPLDITRNAGGARVKGVESDVTWSPTSLWRLSASGDYINARLVSLDVLDSSLEVDDPLDLVPRYQITASVEREFRWSGRPGFARLDYAQRPRATYRNRSIGPWYYSQSDYMYLLGLHVGIHWTSNLEFGAFAQNLLNNRGYIGSDAIENEAARQQPRTFGLTFSVGFP